MKKIILSLLMFMYTLNVNALDLVNSNNMINDQPILEIIIIVFISILGFILYFRIGNKLYYGRKYPLIYKVLFLILYILLLMLLTGEKFVFWLIIVYFIYLVTIKRIKYSNNSLKAIISGNPFDFDEVKFDDKDFKHKAFDIYKNIAYSWSNLDMFPAKDYLSQDMYDLYELQLNSLFLKEQRNVMSNIEFVKSKIKSVKRFDNFDEIVIVMEFKCRDYLISTQDNAVLKGHPSFLMNYIYELTFVRKKEEIKNNVCPTCGAILNKKSKKEKCQYCKSVINKYVNKYVLTKKNLLRQSAKRDE